MSKNKIKRFIKEHRLFWVVTIVNNLKVSYIALPRFYKTKKLELKRLIFHANRKRMIEGYLNAHQIRKLQIGAGGNVLKGWLNTDLYPYDNQIIPMDVTKPFFFGNDTFDYVFCEHMIEHIPYTEGMKMLKECCRVLKPGGRIRISTPDLQAHLDLFKNDKTLTQEQYVGWISNNWLKRQGINSCDEAFVLNLMMHGWGHRFLYNFKVLKHTLEECGFTGVTKFSSGMSTDKNLSSVERHGDTIKDIKAIKKQFGSAFDNQMNTFVTLVVEAVKR